jgi:hypothetical protein
MSAGRGSWPTREVADSRSTVSRHVGHVVCRLFELDFVRKSGYFFLQEVWFIAMQSVENTILKKISGHGRGWAFSPKDFSPLASREAVDLALHRLESKGTIRRILRGLYDYPRFSELLGQQLSPDIDQVAGALARKFGWHIQPSGPAALNLMGVSTHVPGRYVYLSDGPARTYEVAQTELVFENTALKETGFMLRGSALIVQGLKSLGREGITPDIIARIRQWLDPSLRSKVLKDTATVTGWVYEAIRQICREERDG